MSSPGKSQLDTMYPEPLSRLRRGNSDLPSSASYRRAVKKQLHRGNSGRFRTQPVTFHEIKEVDEENLVEAEAETAGKAGVESKSESDLKAKFELFYRSISSNNESSGPRRAPPVSLPVPAGPRHDVIAEDSSPTTSSPSQPTSAPLAIPFNPRSRPSI